MPYELNPILLIFTSYGIGVILTEMLKLMGFYDRFDHQNFLSDKWTKAIGVLHFGWLIRHSFMGSFNKKLKYQGKAKRSDLEQLRSDMTYAEVNHLWGFIALLVFTVLFLPLWKIPLWYIFLLIPLNVLFNLYLVFLQQFNKRRITRIMNRIALIFLMLSFGLEGIAQTASPVIKRQAFTIGESIQIHSDILEEKRTLNIYLPNTYSPDSTKRYPVIYLLDGSTDEDFIHIAGLVQFGSFPWIKMVPETIVVGIGNVDRKRDFTYPSTDERDQKEFPSSGGSAAFLQFLEKELQPLIDQTYKTNSVKTLIGQSLGGLLATEALLKKPDLFDNYIIVSPSLWWDKDSLLKQKPQSFQKPKSIYIAVGKEGPYMERVANELHQKLKASVQSPSRLFFQFFEGQTHGDALHLAVYDAFEKMFRKAETK